MSEAKVVAVDGATQIRTGLSQAGAYSATQSECLRPGPREHCGCDRWSSQAPQPKR
jgi:hypothetical protein